MAVYNACGTGFGGGTFISLANSQAITVGNVKRRRVKIADISAAITKAGGTLTTGDQIVLLPVSSGEVIKYGAVKVITPETTATTLSVSMDVIASAGVADNDATVGSEALSFTPAGALIASGKDLKAAANTFYQTANEANNAFAGATNAIEAFGILVRQDTGVALTITFTGTSPVESEFALAIEFDELFPA